MVTTHLKPQENSAERTAYAFLWQLKRLQGIASNPRRLYQKILITLIWHDRNCEHDMTNELSDGQGCLRIVLNLELERCAAATVAACAR